VPNELGVWRGLVCHKPDGNFILVNRLTTYENNVCYSIDRYELVEKGQIIQTEIETFNVRIYDDPLILTNMLKDVGFKEIKTIKPLIAPSVLMKVTLALCMNVRNKAIDIYRLNYGFSRLHFVTISFLNW